MREKDMEDGKWRFNFRKFISYLLRFLINQIYFCVYLPSQFTRKSNE